FDVCAVGLSVTVMVTLFPTATDPRLQVMLGATVVQVPCVVVTDEMVAPVARSLTVTAAAFDGPRLVTTTEYTAFPPAMTESGPVMVIATSGPPAGVTTADCADSGPLPIALLHARRRCRQCHRS